MALAYGVLSFAILQAVAFGYPTGSVFWPGAGLTLGVLARVPRERWPALLTGVFVAEFVVDLTIPVSPGAALVWAMANTTEPLVGALLITRGGRLEGLPTVSVVLRFVVGAVLLGPLVGSVLGAAAAAVTGTAPFWPTWPRWWIGDGIGVLVVAPALFTRRRPDLAHARRAERWSLLFVLAAVTIATVLPWQEAAWAQGLPFLLAPTLVLAAMRLGPRTAAIALAVSATAINGVTASGHGPFALVGTHGGLVVAQVCVAGAAFALHIVSALSRDLLTGQQVENILRTQALHDDLTGLANRRMLGEQLARALAGLRRGGRTVALVMVDLDRFKSVNDQHGHAAGDAVLVEVAARLRSVVRPDDTVARIGGDEFVVLLPDLADIGPAFECLRRIELVLSRPMTWHGRELELAASVGLSSTSDPEESADEVLAAADHAMYGVKRSRPRHHVAGARPPTG